MADHSLAGARRLSLQSIAARRGMVLALVFIGILILVALAAPLISPYSPTEQLDIVRQKALRPSWAHPFGTDVAARDLLSRVIYGGRTSLSVALLAVMVSTTVGLAFGMIAGFL